GPAPRSLSSGDAGQVRHFRKKAGARPCLALRTRAKRPASARNGPARSRHSLPREPVERIAELARDGARLAAAADPAVALDDRDDLGGGTGQEALVGDVDVVPRQGDLLDADLRLAR